MKTGYLAPEGLEEVLSRELTGKVVRYGRLFVQEGPPVTAHWAQNVWFDVEEIVFRSISEAAAKLREKNRLWTHYPYQCVRRGELIGEKLPYFAPKPLPFPAELPKAPLGAWTLLDEHRLLCAAKTSSPFAHGEIHFQETKIPPSRAYLKLWELFTITGKRPQRGERCLEIGASPGSWTWVLQQLGAEVIAIDRAPLDPTVANLPGVNFRKQDAFALVPQDLPPMDWVFSDVICYPEKLFAWVQPWLKHKVHLVCTLKFQGEIDWEIIRAFSAIEGSSLLHLFHNKHELTWFRFSAF